MSAIRSGALVAICSRQSPQGDQLPAAILLLHIPSGSHISSHSPLSQLGLSLSNRSSSSHLVSPFLLSWIFSSLDCRHIFFVSVPVSTTHRSAMVPLHIVSWLELFSSIFLWRIAITQFSATCTRHNISLLIPSSVPLPCAERYHHPTEYTYTE